MYQNLIVEEDAAIVTITVNRPDKLNAIDERTAVELLDLFSKLDARDEVRVVILTGAGDRSFIAGGDIAAMSRMSLQEGEKFVYLGHKLTKAMEHSNKVVIAAVNGFALGGGTELAMACDIRVASEKAQFGLPEVTVGLFPGWGGTQRLGRLIGKGRAKELIFTGERVSADEAYRLGLVNKVVSPEELMPYTRQLAERILANSQNAIRQAKKALNEGLEVSLDQGLVIEAEAWLVNFSTADRVEGLTAFVEKRKPNFTNR
jgi:enoyl-CoA hydratase/carnithine racemase